MLAMARAGRDDHHDLWFPSWLLNCNDGTDIGIWAWRQEVEHRRADSVCSVFKACLRQWVL